MKNTRTEIEVFSDLSALCNEPEFIHAVAFMSIASNIFSYDGEELKPENRQHLYGHDRLIRSEIAAVQGLMIQRRIDLSSPSRDTLERYIQKAHRLLEEFHQTFLRDFDITKPKDKFFSGKILEEAVFYGPASAYDFQYKDLIPRKYNQDSEWIRSVKHFSVDEGLKIASGLRKMASERIKNEISLQKDSLNIDWLSFCTFETLDVADFVGIDIRIVSRFFEAFQSFHHSNQSFDRFNKYNSVHAQPMIFVKGKFFLLDASWLLEAFYESPFYWMMADKKYKDLASKNRGDFVEKYCAERLSQVFGDENVFQNVKIIKSGRVLGEIDVLVIYSNRALILQAKSKRMTEEARKGNDLKIQSDFQGAIQDAYDQAVDCANLLKKKEGKPVLETGIEVTILEIKEFLLMCIVCDHYPALSHQVREFLKLSDDSTLAPPFILDLFALDTIAEMLDSPVHFLAYTRRRTAYFKELSSSHGTILLSDHLKRNLWLDQECAFAVMDDSIAVDLDVAMMVRRDGFQGQRTPSGILTRTKEGTLGAIFSQFENDPRPEALEFGFLLLRCSGDAFSLMNQMIDRCCELARKDGRKHDVGFPIGNEGITLHASMEDDLIAFQRLKRHCEMRKSASRASFWIGLLLTPYTKLCKKIVCFGEAESEMESVRHAGVKSRKEMTPLNGKASSLINPAVLVAKRKIGGNELCLCGSNKKYKKCCLT